MATIQQPLNGHALPPVTEKIPPQSETSLTPLDLLQIAVTQGADVDKLTRLMELQERWERNEARKAFVSAMNAFKADPPTIVKNASVEFTTKTGKTVKWDHASLDHICDAVISALSKNGISHCWSFEQPTPELIRVTCTLTHYLGHSDHTTLQGPPDTSGDKIPVHAVYSTVVHLQRYTLLAATGLAATAPSAESETSQSNGLTQEEKQNRINAIATAPDKAELFVRFKAAVIEARQADDQNAEMAYTRVKDARKRELR